MTDLVLPFQVEGSNVRGRFARLETAADDIVRRHDYPAPVATLLAEASALTALLGATLKFDGVFSLQAKGDGPVGLLAVDVTTAGALRGYARFDGPRLADLEYGLGPGAGDIRVLLGHGQLAFTVDQGEFTERYQGIVALDGATLAACAEAYFRQSEQLPTRLCLAVEKGAKGNGALPKPWRAAGLMIQHLAGGRAEGPEEAAENWRRASYLFDTATPEELTDPALSPEALLYRLYHEDGVRVFEPKEAQFGCRCERERIASVLKTFPSDDLRDMTLAGAIAVRCEFCNAEYRFDPDAL